MVDQPGRLGLYFAQTLAHGANPSAYMVGTPDLFSSSDFDVVRDVLRFHRDHAEHYAGLVSDARVLVLSSLRSEELLGGGEAIVAERRGVHRALVEEHIPFDLLPAESLVAASDRLSSYDVIVLPNVGCLGDEQCRILDRYVEAGGGLVATYDTAGYDDDGVPRAELGLSSLGGRRVIDRQTTARSAYLKDTDGTMILLDKAFLVVEPHSDAEGSMPLVPPSRYGPPEKCYWDIETDHPGLLSRRHGAGQTALVPWPVGGLFHELRRPEHRRVIASAVRRVARGEPLVETDAPPQVEIVVGRQPGHDRRVVHLVNFSGVDDRAFHDPLEIRDIRLSVRGSFTSARALRLGEELPCTADGSTTSVVLPRLGLFELLVLEA